MTIGMDGGKRGAKGWGDKVMVRSHQCFHSVSVVKLMGSLY